MASTELSQNEQIDRYKNVLLNVFEKEIDDENMRIYIFKDSDYRSALKKKETNYVSYMDNILSLAFVFAYGCYKYDCDNGERCFNAKKPNSIRIRDNFRQAYFDYPITLEFTRFVLCDIQVYMQQMRSHFTNGDDGELYEVFSNLSVFDKNFSLVKYFNMISKKRAYGTRANFNIRETAEMFCDLIHNMPFLKNYALVQDEDGQFCFRRKANYIDEEYSVIPINHILYTSEMYYEEIFSLFSLEKVDVGRKKVLNARYVSGGSYNSLSFNVSSEELNDGVERIDYDAEDFFYEITGASWDREDQGDGGKKDDYLIHHIHAINYKYIKNLALSISDAMVLIHHSREVLYELFSDKYEDIFAKIKDINDVNDPTIDWDGIIVMLLIEASPSKVLETLFENNSDMFYYVVTSLCKRIDDPEMPIYNLSGEALAQKVDEIINKKLIIGEASGFGRLKDNDRGKRNKKLFARAAAMLIISSLSAVLDDRIICAGNIYDNEALLRNIMEDGTNEEKMNAACIVLGETFKHLLCFYKGVVAYGNEKAIIDADNYDKAVSSTEITTQQNNLKQVFLNAAKAEKEQIEVYDTSRPADVAALIRTFIDLSNKCVSSKGSGGLSNGLNVAIGRYEILDVHAFKKGCGTLIEDLEDEIIDDGDDLIQAALKILRFLTTGSYAKGVRSELDAIYPFTATYNRGNENYDGYKTFTFTLNLKRDGKKGVANEINVLTEFKYNLCDVFYCLPNALRSNKRWWIDPLLINFKEFNDIFAE